MPKIKKDEKLCFVGHSLGSVFILHILEKFDLQFDCGIFVSPFLDKLNCDWQIDFVNSTFWKKDFDWENLKKRITKSYTIYSDNDPYMSQVHPKTFAKNLNSSEIEFLGGGHLGGIFTEFSLVFELCKTRIGVGKN